MAMLGEAERARLRRESIGMMFQNAHLFPSLTALENVEMPLRLARMASEQRTRQALEALKQVGLRQRMRHRGLEISNLLRDIAHKAQVGLLVATHDATVVASSDRMLRINDGRIVDE